MVKYDNHSFAICAYKENPFLEETILSLKQQTIASNIFISTSTPNSYVEELCAKHDINMFINPSPRLAGDDWNYAYMKAKTSLVTIAHQDDYYEPRFLEDTLSAFNRYPNNDALMAFSDYYEIRDGTRADHNIVLAVKRLMNFPFRFESLNGRLFIKRRILAFGNPICCPAVTLNKDLAGEAVFDTTYKNSCDYQTWVDLAAVRGRFVYIPRKLVGHRIYEESATSRNIKEDIRSKEDFAILSSLWPAPIARLIHFFFSKSEKSNAIKKT